MDPFKVASALTTNGGAYAGWFIASIEAVVIGFMYKNSVQRDIWENDVCELKDNQKKIIETTTQNSTTMGLILEIIKTLIRHG